MPMPDSRREPNLAWARFLERWTHLERTFASGTPEEYLEEAADLLATLQTAVLPHLDARSASVTAWLSEALQTLEREFQTLSQRTGLEESDAMDRRLFFLEIRLSILQPLVSVIDGRPWDAYHHLLAELRILEGDRPPGTSSQSLHRLRAQLLDERVQRFLGDCEKKWFTKPLRLPLAPNRSRVRMEALWRWIRHGERMLLSLLQELLILHGELPFLSFFEKDHYRFDPHHRETAHLNRLGTLVDGLVERLIETIRSLPPNQARAWLLQHHRQLGDFVAELASYDDERFPLLESFASYRAYRHLHRFHQAVARDPERRHILDLRALRRLERRLRADWVERILSLRLHHYFGPRFEHRLDLSVLIAVLLAIVLLGIELSVPLDETRVFQILVADTLLCFFLLGDFFLRLFLAPDRLLYFRRHWLTDLLPVIPFGAIGQGLQSLVLEAEGLYVLRLVRVIAMVLRKARPLIKLARLILFAVRGMDRLVRRYRRLLNWNIVFFEPEPQEERGMGDRWQRLHRRIGERRRALLNTWGEPQINAWFFRRFRWLQMRAARVGHSQLVGALRSPSAPELHRSHRCIAVESLIKRLLQADREQLMEMLGDRFSHQIMGLLWLTWIPPLRWIPPFSDLLAAYREAGRDEWAFTQAAARRMGARLDSLNRIAQFIADMQGIITPSQLLDRIGTALIESMRRPRNRFLLFGSGFILVSLLVELTRASWLEAAAAWLRQTLGWPILILGLFALIAVWLGTRLRDLAQTNAEFFTRIAEAKSLGLLSEIKRDRAAFDQTMLLERVLVPEARIQGLPEEALSQITQAGHLEDFSHLVRQILSCKGDASVGSLAERVYLLYQDYLRGIPFHACNTGSIAQLLGDPSLHNLRTRFLGQDAAQEEALQRLDPRHPSGLLGPSLWPRFITLAITQYTGQLVEEYNRHALPLAERTAPPRTPDEIARFAHWLRRRQGRNEEPDPECREPPDRAAQYATTAFTALDFLSNDPVRFEAIRRQFGTEIAELVALDRRRLIQRIFGVPPHHRKEIPKRSLNPYELYQRFLANGRVFLLPFTLFLGGVRVARWGLHWLWETFQDLRRPQIRCAPVEEDVYSDYRIAYRKLLRMHRPVLLAGIRLRAQVDPEYLGLTLPEQSFLDSSEPQDLFRDLRRIQASPEDHRRFQPLIQERSAALGEWAELWAELAAPDGFISRRLRALYPDHPNHRRAEALRALSIAYVTDYQNLRRLFQLPRRIPQILERVLAARGRVPPRTRRWSDLGRSLRRWQHTRDRRWEFDRWWARMGRPLLPKAMDPERGYAWCLRWWRADVDELGTLIGLAVASDFQPRQAALDRVEPLLRSLSSLTEHLVTLRAVQTLGILELEASVHIVRGLGEYTDGEGRPPPQVRIPTL